MTEITVIEMPNRIREQAQIFPHRVRHMMQRHIFFKKVSETVAEYTIVGFNKFEGVMKIMVNQTTNETVSPTELINAVYKKLENEKVI